MDPRTERLLKQKMDLDFAGMVPARPRDRVIENPTTAVTAAENILKGVAVVKPPAEGFIQEIWEIQSPKGGTAKVTCTRPKLDGSWIINVEGLDVSTYNPETNTQLFVCTAHVITAKMFAYLRWERFNPAATKNLKSLGVTMHRVTVNTR